MATAGVAVKGFIEAAKNSEVSSTRMQAQLKASGISYDKYGGRIDSVIAKQSALAGLDDEDLQDSFTNIVRVTGDVNEALKLNGLAADIARAKGIDLSAASKIGCEGRWRSGNGVLPRRRHDEEGRDGAGRNRRRTEEVRRSGGGVRQDSRRRAGALRRRRGRRAGSSRRGPPPDSRPRSPTVSPTS